MRLFRHDDPQHIETAELLPWLVNGTLDPDELARVERHIADCIACKQELAHLRASYRLYQTEGDDAAASRGLARVEARIDEIESSLAGQRVWRRIAAGWKALPGWARVALIVQAALIVSTLLLIELEPHDPYALGAPASRTAARAALVVVFDPALPEREIRLVLLSIGARIVDGPSLEGSYTLEVKADEERRVLAQLRAHRAVFLADPAAARKR